MKSVNLDNLSGWEGGLAPLFAYLLLNSDFRLPSPNLKTSADFKSRLLVATFVVYIAVVAGVTVVPTHLARFRRADPNHINIIPLDYSFRCFLQDRNAHPHLTAFCLRNTLGNLALFVPFGILLPLVSTRFRSLKRVLLLAVCASLMIETIQFVLRFVGSPRAVDIDDVLLNTLGAGGGFIIYRLLVQLPAKSEQVRISEESAGLDT